MSSAHRDNGCLFELIRPLFRGVSAAGGRIGEITLKAVNRRGRTISVRLARTPLHPADVAPSSDGAIVIMQSDGR